VSVFILYPGSSVSDYSVTRLVNLAILAIMAIVCGIADSEIEQSKFPEGAPWLYGDDISDDNPKINGLITWAFALITFVFMIDDHPVENSSFVAGSKI